jgi:hypothetical protein
LDGKLWLGPVSVPAEDIKVRRADFAKCMYLQHFEVSILPITGTAVCGVGEIHAEK